MPQVTYLLPLRRTRFSASEASELADYFRDLAEAGCEVLVVDGSPSQVFAEHSEAWRSVCRHEKVDRSFGYLNDKMNGIHTGVRLAAMEKIILADDDIRYAAAEIDRVSELLDEFEVVRPQNFLSPLPWWGRIEAARMLINRATLRTADYPGTCAFRRETMLRVGPYDGDVLFDNEEIIRHFASEGVTVNYATNLFVRKRPPTLRKWMEQRPRQAYEDFALRTKTGLFFSIPIVAAIASVLLGWNGIAIWLGLIFVASVSLALVGWIRGAARNHFPSSVCFFAPLWVLERAASTYWAL